LGHRRNRYVLKGIYWGALSIRCDYWMYFGLRVWFTFAKGMELLSKKILKSNIITYKKAPDFRGFNY